MRRRLKRKYEKERIRGLYENAGLFYRLNGDIRKALEMYENAGVTERIVSILVDNARHAANSGYYYDLKNIIWSFRIMSSRKVLSLCVV